MRRTLLLSIATLLLASCVSPSAQTPVPNAYDAVAILGFGPASTESLPTPGPGEVVVRYSGWSINQLRSSEIGKDFLWIAKEDETSDWANRTFAPGIYTLKPLEPVPAPVLAAALLSYRVQKGPIDFDKNPDDPLLGMADKLHCKDAPKRDDLIGMNWGDDWGPDGKTHSIKLAIDPEYCNVLGGGVWEARLK